MPRPIQPSQGLGCTFRVRPRSGKKLPVNEDHYLSQPQAARHLGVSVATIQRRIADGTLPAYRSGRMVRVKLSDLERMMKRIPTMGAVA